jgi:hypothetical protein
VTEDNNTNVPEPDRYSVEYVDLSSESEETFLAIIQETLNEGTRHSWKLNSVTQSPTGKGLLVVWDQQGFISG